MRWAARGAGADRGSATVWGVGVIAVLCVVFGAVLALGQAVVTRHRAAGGADLAALAAAEHWADGSTVACDRAGRVAREQGARLVRCAVVGDVSDVTAAAGRGPFTARVRARAGFARPPGAMGPVSRTGLMGLMRPTGPTMSARTVVVTGPVGPVVGAWGPGVPPPARPAGGS